MSMDAQGIDAADPGTWPDTVRLVRCALSEDVGSGDVTTLALVPPGARSAATVLSKSRCVVAGTAVAMEVFRQVDPAILCHVVASDGAAVEIGDAMLSIEGPAGSILTAERTALNIMQRLCGIATLTRRFVEAVRPLPTAILDTRKTTPGMRRLEKYAVRCGGGVNHRMGLFDMVLIKDNHRRFWGRRGQALHLDDAVTEARRRFPGVPVEIEVETEEELVSALPARPEWVLLDNMSPDLMVRCVAMCRGICRTEASGGITLETVRSVAQTGVDAISIGALTHSAPAADLSLELIDHENSSR